MEQPFNPPEQQYVQRNPQPCFSLLRVPEQGPPGPLAGPDPRRGGQVAKALLGYPPPSSWPPWSLNDVGIVLLLLWVWLPHQHNESIGQSLYWSPQLYDFLCRPFPSLPSHPDPLAQSASRMENPGKPFFLLICPYLIAPAVSSL